MNIKEVLTNFKEVAGEHSPEILTGIGIAGMITTTILAVRATPKALYLIDEKELERCEDLTKAGKLKVAWKCYVPAIVSGTVSIACLVGANSVNAKRNAALATAYKIAETSLIEYKDKVVETIGEKKERDIREKINQDRIDNNPISNNVVVATGLGDSICYDSFSGRYFLSSIDKILDAKRDLNERLYCEMYISLSEFYDELGLDHTKYSDDIGWNIDETGKIYIDITTQLVTDETSLYYNHPCIAIDYTVIPRNRRWA